MRGEGGVKGGGGGDAVKPAHYLIKIVLYQ